MTNWEYLKKITKSVNQSMDYDYDWEIEEFGDGTAEASTTVRTVAGTRTCYVHCNGDIIFPVIMLADANDINNLSRGDYLAVLEHANAINFQYGNTVVAFISYENSIAALRGVQYKTFQNDLNAYDCYDDPAFLQAVGSIVDFFTNINTEYCSNNDLREFLRYF